MFFVYIMEKHHNPEADFELFGRYEVRLDKLPYEYIRWIDNPQDFDLAKLSGTSDMKKVKDLKDRPLLLFVNEWSIRMTQERNDGLVLTEFAR